MLSDYGNGGSGCSIETLAELIGDTPKVAFDHYGKEWGHHYQEPLWAAVGVAPPSPRVAKPATGKPAARGPQRPPRQKPRAR